MRHRHWFLSSLGLLAVACGPPPRNVPVLPPGIDAASQYKTVEGDEAQAIGEPSGSTGETPKAVVKEPDEAPPIGDVAARTTPTGLKIQVLSPGQGDVVASPGKKVTVHYTGWVEGGKKFDSSRERTTPWQFTLGQGDVIKGWDEGVAGMTLHERRRLTIPPVLGYGSKEQRKIPANSTLVFDIEFLGVDLPPGASEPPPAPKPAADARPKAAAEMPDPFSPPAGRE